MAISPLVDNVTSCVSLMCSALPCISTDLPTAAFRRKAFLCKRYPNVILRKTPRGASDPVSGQIPHHRSCCLSLLSEAPTIAHGQHSLIPIQNTRATQWTISADDAHPCAHRSTHNRATAAQSFSQHHRVGAGGTEACTEASGASPCFPHAHMRSRYMWCPAGHLPRYAGACGAARCSCRSNFRAYRCRLSSPAGRQRAKVGQSDPLDRAVECILVLFIPVCQISSGRPSNAASTCDQGRLSYFEVGRGGGAHGG